MRVRILMMQKDESLLLEPWLAYHVNLVGAENVTVFDNGSKDEGVRSILKAATAKGVNVILQFNTREDFAQKGTRIADQIRAFDKSDPADFYIPIDCDEFVVARTQYDNFVCCSDLFFEALRPHMGESSILQIGFGYDNNPRLRGTFFTKGRLKTFFAQNTVKSLDLGFHRGSTILGGGATRTQIGYIHMHNKPFKVLIDSARTKMEGRVPDFSVETLLAHREKRGTGFHLVSELLLQNDQEYIELLHVKYKDIKLFQSNVLEERMRSLNVDLPY